MKFNKKTFIIIGLVLVFIILLIFFEKMYITDNEIKKLKESQNKINKEVVLEKNQNADIQYIEDDGYEINMNIKIKRDWIFRKVGKNDTNIWYRKCINEL